MNLQRELKELTEEVGRKQLQCSALEKEEAEKRKLLLDVKENYNVVREKQEQMLPLVTAARKQKRGAGRTAGYRDSPERGGKFAGEEAKNC